VIGIYFRIATEERSYIATFNGKCKVKILLSLNSTAQLKGKRNRCRRYIKFILKKTDDIQEDSETLY